MKLLMVSAFVLKLIEDKYILKKVVLNVFDE